MFLFFGDGLFGFTLSLKVRLLRVGERGKTKDEKKRVGMRFCCPWSGSWWVCLGSIFWFLLEGWRLHGGRCGLKEASRGTFLTAAYGHAGTVGDAGATAATAGTRWWWRRWLDGAGDAVAHTGGTSGDGGATGKGVSDGLPIFIYCGEGRPLRCAERGRHVSQV